jgi:hypothetical protein
LVLAVQNAVDLRDLGTATGGANLFRTWISRLVPADFLDGFNPNSLQASPAIIRALPEGMRDVLVEATGNALSPVFLTAALMARGGAARGAVPRGEAAAKASPDVNEKISFWCRRDQVSRGVPAYRARNVSTG